MYMHHKSKLHNYVRLYKHKQHSKPKHTEEKNEESRSKVTILFHSSNKSNGNKSSQSKFRVINIVTIIVQC